MVRALGKRNRVVRDTEIADRGDSVELAKDVVTRRVDAAAGRRIARAPLTRTEVLRAFGCGFRSDRIHLGDLVGDIGVQLSVWNRRWLIEIPGDREHQVARLLHDRVAVLLEHRIGDQRVVARREARHDRRVDVPGGILSPKVSRNSVLR